MNVKIKKGDKFKCIKDFIMEEGNIAYIKNKEYISDKDGNLPDEELSEHYMHYYIENGDDPNEFWEHFEKVESDVKDNVNPDHYKQGKVECIDALESATVNKTGIEAVCTSQIIKYIWRYESKNGLEDVKKAAWYINYLIKILKK